MTRFPSLAPAPAPAAQRPRPTSHFDQPDSPDPAAGATGKAAVLLELQAAGFPVPDFLVAGFPVVGFPVVGQLPDPADSDEASPRAPVTGSAPEGRLTERFIPENASPQELAEFVLRLGLPLAVRSSASVEDRPGASFAGQFQSFLNLQTVPEVLAAMVRCRESLRSPSVLEYCRQIAVDPACLSMNVILQRMVQPELAGVAFTVNPVTGAEEVVVEACEGLADELLAGHRTPVPDSHPLLKQHRSEIVDLALRVQRHFGAPQDIEFAIEHGIIWILQSRPITRIGFSGVDGEWTNADFRDGGVSSDVCSPLMWSLYELIWNTTLKGCLREVHLFSGDFQAARTFFGRPYWNLGAVKQCVAKIPGFVERDFDADLSVQVNYSGDGTRTPWTCRSLLRVLPVAFAVSRFVRRQSKIAEAIVREGVSEFNLICEAIPTDPATCFRSLVEGDYFRLECRYFRTIFALSLAKMDFMMAFPGADYPSLTGGLARLQHSEPLRRLRELSLRGDSDITPLLSEFSHHYSQGLDIIRPRWDEDPEFVKTLLTSLPPASTGDAPSIQSESRYEQARSAFAASLPFWQRSAFHRKLDRLRNLVWLREELRDLSGKLYYLIRRCALGIGRQSGAGDDVFFMTYDEVFQDDRSHVPSRRSIWESYRNFRAPHEIGGRFFCQPAPLHGDIRGIGASPGRVQGTARVARTVADAIRLPTGSILVCPCTDPGWTPALNRVAAVITEAGGLLSHAAVICREFGIPAVLGVPSATDRIPDGATVVVDGASGCVSLQQPTEAI